MKNEGLVREKQNLRGAVELLAGAGATSRVVLLHHGHRLRVHRLRHSIAPPDLMRTRRAKPRMRIRRAGGGDEGDSPVPRGRARAPPRPPRAPAPAQGSGEQLSGEERGGRDVRTWRRSECAELERRDASGARWWRWSCSTRCATSGGGGGRDAAAAFDIIAGGAGGGHSRGNRSVGLFELGGAREVVVGWWPLDR